MLNDTERLEELRRFLKDHRARLVPADVGLPPTPRRRVRGLRREEVATLAGIGISWYTALENGDGRGVSDDALLAVAGALRLSESERRYLFALAGRIEPELAIEPPSRLIVDAMESIAFPAYIISAAWEVVACNAPFRRVWAIGADELPFNAIDRLFLDERARAMHGEHFAANAAPVVAMIHSALARRPHLTSLYDLRDRLVASDEVQALWDRYEICDPTIPSKATIDSAIGPFTYDALTLPAGESLLGIVVQVPGAESRSRL